MLSGVQYSAEITQILLLSTFAAPSRQHGACRNEDLLNDCHLAPASVLALQHQPLASLMSEAPVASGNVESKVSCLAAGIAASGGSCLTAVFEGCVGRRRSMENRLLQQ